MTVLGPLYSLSPILVVRNTNIINKIDTNIINKIDTNIINKIDTNLVPFFC